MLQDEMFGRNLSDLAWQLEEMFKAHSLPSPSFTIRRLENPVAVVVLV